MTTTSSKGNRGYSGRFKKGTHWRERKPWWSKKWLYREYVVKSRSAQEIATEGHVTANTICFWLRKHNIASRSMAESRKIKYWGLRGPDNPMWGRCGAKSPHWKGGVTAERQDFYASQKWKRACRDIWCRDNATCQLCGSPQASKKSTFHIHHIVSFSNKALRVRRSNLVLLCVACHRFVHSRKNVNHEFMAKK